MRGRAEHRPDLAGGVVDARRRRRRTAVGRLRVAVAASGAQTKAMPKPSSAIGARICHSVAVGAYLEGDPPHRQRGDRETGGRQRARVHPVGELADDRRHHDRHERHRHEQQRRLGRRHAADQLHVEHQREAHRRRREATSSRSRSWRSRSCGRGRAAAGRAARLRLTACHQTNRAEEDEPGDDQAPHRDRALDRAPVVLVALLDAEHEQRTCRARSARRRASRTCGRASAGSGTRRNARNEADDADRDVDEEDPLPAEAVDEHAAEDRARRASPRRPSRPTAPSPGRARWTGRSG